MADCLLRIIQSEQQQTGGASYHQTLRLLQQQGAPGATVRRCERNLDNAGYMHAPMAEDAYFDNVAVTIESILDRRLAGKLIEPLKGAVPEGLISILDGTRAILDGNVNTPPIQGEAQPGQNKGNQNMGIDTSRDYVVKVFTKETPSMFKKDEHQKVMEFLQKKGITWATATRGIVGYGRDKVVHQQTIFSLSRNTPVIVEFVVSGNKLPELLTALDQMVVEGAVFSAPITLVCNR